MAARRERTLVIGVLVVGAISGCHESVTDGGGSAGGAAEAGSGARAGGAAGAGKGAAGQTANAGSSGRAGTGSAGNSARAGTGGAGGAVASPYSGWADACGGVTMNGRCVGETFEWCDYLARGVLRLDCAARGMRCVAAEEQTYEDERNGCAGAPCTSGTDSCDGSIAVNCMLGELIANSCRRQHGEGSVCSIRDGRARCSYAMCEDVSQFTCDGTALVICNEDGNQRIGDCARCNPAGTCTAAGPGEPRCTHPTFDCR